MDIPEYMYLYLVDSIQTAIYRAKVLPKSNETNELLNKLNEAKSIAQHLHDN